MTGGTDLTLFEVNEAMSIIHDSADPDANIIFGAVLNEALGDEMKITVIATGFDKAAAAGRTCAHLHDSATDTTGSRLPSGTEH